jgi:SAM-dependent methyltransferase
MEHRRSTIGEASAAPQKGQRYWLDFANVERAVREFIALHGVDGVMPTGYQLTKAGYNGLVHAIQRYYSYPEVAERLSLGYGVTRKPRGYWEDPANLERELRAFAASQGTPNVMPTGEQLELADRHDLKNAILKRKYGGYRRVAEAFGLELSPNVGKPHRYWDDFANVRDELLTFIATHGTPGVLPSKTELVRAGRSDLTNAFRLHGGANAVGERLGLDQSRQQIQYGHQDWDDFAILERELLAFIDAFGIPGVMPAYREFVGAGRTDLYKALRKYRGGPTAVAKRLGLVDRHPLPDASASKPPGYWKDFANVEPAVRHVVAVRGEPGLMPTGQEFEDAGFSGLAQAIVKHHGGIDAVARRLGLSAERQARVRNKGLDDVATFERALLTFIAEHGEAGRMPTLAQFKQHGRSDLGRAIRRHHGGVRAVADRLGLALGYKKQQDRYWADFANVARELTAFVDEHGTPGVMPTNNQFRDADRSDLAAAILAHGGFPAVAERLGWASHRRPYDLLTTATAADAERTARAIQPLTESNLLSPAQIMVILRRVGLLEHRNQRLVRLSASLARGNHNEIETALAAVTAQPDAPGLEADADDVVESEIDEITDLAPFGLDANPDSRLAQPSGSPLPSDQAREEALIRGLSAIGALRLPLDDVLRLLTSKLLWDAFYRRLYAWYGSLDATHQVTVDDVNAAILSTYPQHADNDFVAEAARRFAEEVGQAVNLAAALPSHGWRGPRLRLHQADAARRMAAVLSTTDEPHPFLLNADDPGMGKSAAFLAGVALSDVRRVVIVAPKTVADDTWASRRGEIARCLPHARIIRGLDQAVACSPSDELTFIVLHYEELLDEERAAALGDCPIDALCLDEVHLVKQRAGQAITQRRSALQLVRSGARAAIGLTGTPLVNELAEPLSLLQILSAEDPRFAHSRLSNRRMSDIADVFESLLPHVIRRRKREVLLHLPGCEVRPVLLPLPDDVEAATLAVYGWPRSRAGEALVELRKLAIPAKLPYLLQRAEAADKLLILTYLTDDVSEQIAAYLEEFLPGRVAHINGQTPGVERAQTIAAFRAPEGVRVLVGTVGTVGVGLTLFDPTADRTATELVVADLPYTWAEFEQGIARLDREGQRRLVHVDVLQTTTAATLRDGAAIHTLDERIWDLIEGKRELAEVAVDGRYATDDAATKVQRALRRWLRQAREVGVEPVAVERRPEPSAAQRWRGEIARLRGMSAARADDVFADPDYTRAFLGHLRTSAASQLSHHWLRSKLSVLMRSDLTVVDLGCGLNQLADLPCRVIGLDRHDLPGVVRGKMEAVPFPADAADVVIFSLSLYGTAADLLRYFAEAARVLRGGGHLFIVEPASAFSVDGLARFIKGLQRFGFELVGAPKELRSEADVCLRAMHFTLSGDPGRPDDAFLLRK